MTRFLATCILLLFPIFSVQAQDAEPNHNHVAIMDMNMMILPGTQSYLTETLEAAEREGAALLIVRLDTPGGLLTTSQEMIQILFQAPIPVVIYVSPSGGTATSAGVFITLAGHIAAMAPGTSIGAAHPVLGSGQDIEGDMRAKAENMTMAMVRAISEQRGRNIEWAEKSVKESSSITEQEAVKKAVVDFVAEDIDDLLKKASGRTVQVKGEARTLGDYQNLPRRIYDMSLKDRAVNLLADPNVVALLWLGATTGLSLELYNPGTLLPGTVGIICLILALAASQVIPISQGAVLLLAVGAILIGLELFIPSGIAGIGGLIAIVLGALYLIDTAQAPGLQVNLSLILPVALALGGFLLLVAYTAAKTFRKQVSTGYEGLVGMDGVAKGNISDKGKVFINGEYWNAEASEGIIEDGAEIEVVEILDGMVLRVKKIL